MANLLVNQTLLTASDEVHNFLEPSANWVGYHPMGGSKFPGTTNIPHLNIIRDNGKVKGQTIYFSPITLSLEYGRGTDGATVSDRSIISWKQMHLATLNSIPVTDQDRIDYMVFAKIVREEIREVAAGMIESAYMDIRFTSLTGVKNIVTSSGFRKLRMSLNARVNELLLILEDIKGGEDNVDSSDEYKSVFYELKELYNFKYMVKADDLAKTFMEMNNVTVRVPLNQKKRYTDFITVIFRIKLTSMHKNSFMPMFTKYSADKDGKMDEGQRHEIKCHDVEKNGYHFVYLSKTKAVLPAVKREAYVEKHAAVQDGGQCVGMSASAVNRHDAVEEYKNILRRRGEEYFGKLKDSNNGIDGTINKQAFMDLVSLSDSEYANMLTSIDKPSPNGRSISKTRNPYLEQRARNIERAQGHLLSLELIDREQADTTIKEAWELSEGDKNSEDWCDLETMSLWTDSNDFGCSNER